MPMRRSSTILVVSAGEHLGDALVMLPFLLALRRIEPHAHISHAVSRTSRLAGLQRELDLPRLVDRRQERLGLFGVLPRRAPWRNLPAVDRVFLLRTRWIDVAAAAAGLRYRELYTMVPGFAGSTRKPRVRRRPAAVAARALAMLDGAYGVEVALEDTPPLRPHPSRGNTLPSSPERSVALYVGARPDRRSLPLPWLVRVVRELEARGLHPALLVGPRERDTVSSVRTALPELEILLRADGAPLSIGEVAAIAPRLSVLIAKDGGLAHLLAGAGVPTVCMLVNPRPLSMIEPWIPEKWLPWGAPVIPLSGAWPRNRDAQDIDPLQAVEAAVSMM